MQVLKNKTSQNCVLLRESHAPWKDCFFQVFLPLLAMKVLTAFIKSFNGMTLNSEKKTALYCFYFDLKTFVIVFIEKFMFSTFPNFKRQYPYSPHFLFSLHIERIYKRDSSTCTSLYGLHFQTFRLLY